MTTQEGHMGTLSRGEIMLFILTALAGVITGAVVAVPSYWGTNREMDVKMVEIAVGILSQDPKENIAPAHEWAVDVVSHYAEVKPSAEVRKALVDYRAVSDFGYGDYYTSYTLPQSTTYTPPK
jgi:hypothetical protein